jgi:hypothetical protein
VALPLALNALKFGHPLDTGYLRIYEQRDDELARGAKTYGLFSPHFIPRNLYYANLGFPRVERIVMAGEEQIHFVRNRYGTGIWWTTPLLIWLFVDGRRILGNPRSRMLLVAAAAVFAALMCFHGTGFEQRGYNRFSLDYLPVLLVLVAPYCCEGWRKWLSLAMVVWSVIYFRLLI